MTVKTLIQHPDFVLIQDCDCDPVISSGFTSDLLSDVMGNASADAVLITIQSHKNTIAVATLVDIPAVILCSGRQPDDEMKKAAAGEAIILIGTTMNQFETSAAVAKMLNESNQD